jgi:uncharacterized membrane protein SirB2
LYLVLKYLHMTLAVATLCGLLLRWVWMLRDSPLFRHRITRILPHIIDTLFLLAGVSMAVMIGQYPFVHAWLTAKVLGLVVYIVLGEFALRRARKKASRTIAMSLAAIVFIYVFSVARSKSVLGFLGFVT